MTFFRLRNQKPVNVPSVPRFPHTGFPNMDEGAPPYAVFVGWGFLLSQLWSQGQ
jgi:hypothetical protein